MQMAAKLLIVDDEQAILSLMDEWLQDAGYEVRTASNGQEGVGVLKEFQADLVISDVWMPGMDGYHFARLVRKACDAQILMITGVPQEAAVLKDMKVDIDSYLVKPFSLRDFLQHVEKLLQNKGPHSSSEEERQGSMDAQSKYVDRLLSSTEDRLLEMYRKLAPGDCRLVEAMIARLADANDLAKDAAREDYGELTDMHNYLRSEGQTNRVHAAAGVN